MIDRTETARQAAEAFAELEETLELPNPPPERIRGPLQALQAMDGVLAGLGLGASRLFSEIERSAATDLEGAAEKEAASAAAEAEATAEPSQNVRSGAAKILSTTAMLTIAGILLTLAWFWFPRIDYQPTEQSTAQQQQDLLVFRAPEMVVLPAGEFLMGSADSDDQAEGNEKPQHRVQIGYQLAVSRYPVTFEEWDAFVADGGTDYRPPDNGWGRGRRPVIYVSWYDAKQYVAWLSRKTGQTYRLLSEAEWEYVARAGTTTRRWWGDGITPQDANYGNNIGRTTEVGSYPESPFKVYDILGNVWEWVEDCWKNNYSDAPDIGAAAKTLECGLRVLRSGSWTNGPRAVRSAYRYGSPAESRSNVVGFRVARTF